jgi:hypothetical protein
MYLVRDCFQLKFGAFREAHELVKDAKSQQLFPEGNSRILSDFTGASYRLIFEIQFDSLSDYEKNLSEGMRAKEWQDWYQKFKPLIVSSEREILKIH